MPLWLLQALSWRPVRYALALLALSAAVWSYGAWSRHKGHEEGRQECVAEQALASVQLAAKVWKAQDAEAEATIRARSDGMNRAADIQSRRNTAEGIGHEPREAVPAGCPAPDPRLVRLDAEARGNVRRSEDRLRSLRRPDDGGAEPAAAR